MYFLVNCTDTILRDISNPKIFQKSIASLYSHALRSECNGIDRPDWERINQAIVERWSLSGLERIKNNAHKIYRENCPDEYSCFYEYKK